MREVIANDFDHFHVGLINPRDPFFIVENVGHRVGGQHGRQDARCGGSVNAGQPALFNNNPSAAFAWNVGGTFTAKVTVSDMKGHSVQATKRVTVTDSIGTWTTRANTSGGRFTALAANSNTVLAVGEDYGSFQGASALSTNDITWSANTLGANREGYGAAWDNTDGDGDGLKNLLEYARGTFAGQRRESKWRDCRPVKAS